MRPLRFFLLYLAAVFLGAALLSPWLYRLAHWAGGELPWLAGLGRQPFHRYVNRCLLGLALVGLWPLLRRLGVRSWSAVGLVKPSGNWRRLGIGFALGFTSLAIVACLAMTGGARVMKDDVPAEVLLSKIFSAGLTAIVVGFLEEVLFRGALFGALRKVHGWITALILSSAIYGVVHFFQKPASPMEITWASGLELLPRMLRGFGELEMLVPGFFTLFLAGMILGLAYQRTGNLYLSIGLHAGWIFWLKFYGTVTVAMPLAHQWFWGTDKLVDGWLASGILLAILVGLWRLPLEQETSPHAISARV